MSKDNLLSAMLLRTLPSERSNMVVAAESLPNHFETQDFLVFFPSQFN